MSKNFNSWTAKWITPQQYKDMVDYHNQETFFLVTQDIYDLVCRKSDKLPDYEMRWVYYDEGYGCVIPTTLGDEAARAGVGAIVSDSRFGWSVGIYGT